MNDYDEKTFAARIADMAELSQRRGMVFTHFLNEKQQLDAESELRKSGYENYCFFGGIENADRRILCVFGDYCRPENSDFPISCITFRYKTAYRLSHRDFLGALTALNIKREIIGDILTGDGITQVFIIETVKQMVLDEIVKVGSVGVSATSDKTQLLDKSCSYKEIKGTVASLRLDSILSLALGISRSKAVSAISSGKTEVNYKPIENTSCILKTGNIFTVRGNGKFRLESVSGISKKGRIHIIVLKYC